MKDRLNHAQSRWLKSPVPSGSVGFGATAHRESISAVKETAPKFPSFKTIDSWDGGGAQWTGKIHSQLFLSVAR